jgi:hypothetical protein
MRVKHLTTTFNNHLACEEQRHRDQRLREGAGKASFENNCEELVYSYGDANFWSLFISAGSCSLEKKMLVPKQKNFAARALGFIRRGSTRVAIYPYTEAVAMGSAGAFAPAQVLNTNEWVLPTLYFSEGGLHMFTKTAIVNYHGLLSSHGTVRIQQ